MDLKEEYGNKLSKWGLDQLRKTDDIKKYLALSPNEIDAMNLQDVDKALIILGQYQIYLQKELNYWSMRQERENKIFKEKLDRKAKNIDSKKGTTLAEKRAIALEEDEELQKLKKGIEKAEVFARTLDKIPDAINSQIVNFRKIEDTKKAEKRNHSY